MKIVKIEDLHCDGRLARQFLSQGHHRRGHRRLVGIHGRLWRAKG